MNKEEKIKHLKELIKEENPAMHRWIDKLNKEIRKLERQR